MRAPLTLSGRCYWGRRTGEAGQFVYSAVLDAAGGKCAGNTPLTFVGNSYYERRFDKKASSASPSLPPLHAGDVVLKSSLAVPAHLRSRRTVDVTGIQTSYFDASERNRRALCAVGSVIQSMHLYDGHEVPELRRGNVALGKVVALCAYATSGASASSPAVPSLVLLENVARALTKRRSLLYYSEADGVQLVRVIAEGCRAAAEQEIHIQPVMRDGCVVAVRLDC
uniref:Uncharacterized protein TCIL3000_11_4430 n=1 Tax=Trypanosoma congolense (strain IL3000) TaxID=1068625 RepID=G0V068_TRYCI|nr:unnamed protein product [Trypanosoma congolense IL3000]